MCGIAGVLAGRDSRSSRDVAAIAEEMARRLHHRGPDDSGTWVDEVAGLAFGHTRLAVVDLSPTGEQPMVSRDGRWVMNFNGEIYNHPQLRAQLNHQGIELKGSSDTEVFLELVAAAGVRETVPQLNGMFAAALWDRLERSLWLVRDRIGEKPLYFGSAGDDLVFGSELKALRAHPDLNHEIDREALAAYLRAGYVPAPFSIYRDIRKLPPGHLMEVKLHHPRPTPEPYWLARDAVEAGLGAPLDVSPSEAEQLMDEELRRSVGLRMIADVPVGAFLSGGIDSSLVTSIMETQSSLPVRTFTVGFTESSFDEAPFARQVAAHLKTDHTELYVQPREAAGVIPLLPQIYDEPFADSSQIPTFLVSRLARTQVTVALSGDGGDELFAGYDRHHFHRRLGRRIAAVPAPLRRLMSRRLLGIDLAHPGAVLSRLDDYSRHSGSSGFTLERVQKLARVLGKEDAEATYISLVSLWDAPEDVVLGVTEPRTTLTATSQWVNDKDLLNTLLWLDLVTYLPDDLLVKVDRAAMAVSLETRLPLLDHELVEKVWRLPLNLKVRNGEAKWLLKKVLSRYVPVELFDRPKKGFSVPLADWLRGSLRAWAEDLLDPSLIARQGFLSNEVVRAAWQEHLSGTADRSHEIWSILMFQAWMGSEEAARAGASE